MPSKSKKQHNLMAAVANNPKFAKKVGIPQSVGEDYVEADKGRKFRSGGMAGCGTKRMKAGGPTGTKKMMMGGPAKNNAYKAGGPTFPDLNKDGKVTQADILQGRGVTAKKMNMGGKVKGYKKGGCVGDGCAIRGRTKGTMR